MLLVSWDCRISAYTNSRRKKEIDRISYETEFRMASTHPSSRTLAPTPVERVTTRVPLAEIRGPFQDLGRAVLGRRGDATSSAAWP
jgi:hypothetical protein